MGAGKRVLIVDDEPDSVEVIRTVLSDLGDLEFLTAGDGQTGVRMAKELKPDLIVMDVMMPRKDGFSALYDLRHEEETAEVPVIMLTGVSGKAGLKVAVEAMGEHFGKEPEAFIDKPIDPCQLKEVAKRALGL